jgi:crossover junction endodeoxyribonuclease RuvC
MRVLAIDPGYDRCGIAVIERVNSKEHVVHSQCFVTDRTRTFPERLTSIGTEVERILTVHKPDMVAIEALYWGTNQKTAMGVAEVRGMLIYLTGKARLPLYEYTPPQVKTGVTGDGRSDKIQVTAMVKRLVKLPPGKRHDDEYDAIALGLTCLASVRFPTHVATIPPASILTEHYHFGTKRWFKIRLVRSRAKVPHTAASVVVQTEN